MFSPRSAAARQARLVVLLATTIALVGCSSTPSPSTVSAATATASASASATQPTTVARSPQPQLPTAAAPSPSAQAGPPVGDSFPILGIAPQPAPGSITCSGPIGATDPVALVNLRADATTGVATLRDYANPAKPRSACRFDVSVTQVIDSRHVVVVVYGDQFAVEAEAVVDLPAVRYHWFKLPEGGLLAVAPDLHAIAWQQHQGGPNGQDAIHVTTKAGDKVVASLPDSKQGVCSTESYSNNAAFTRSSSALFVLDEPMPEISLVVIKARSAVLSMLGKASEATSTRPTQALWSPTAETLFYTQGGNVWGWTQALGRQIAVPNASWTGATLSPDGTHLAFAAHRADGHSEVYLVDLVNGTGAPVRVGHDERADPVFLNDTQLFYETPPDFGCMDGQPPTTFIYNLATRTESPSVIRYVFGVWPATATTSR